ncbi:polyphenol oxidase family protein [Candidatus Peregrinibacteria bacterium]|nr:polyphenol oxidase family protein [Candidatus Peregrinibacteria bacterium]
MIIRFPIFRLFSRWITYGATTASEGSFNEGQKNFEKDLKKLMAKMKMARPVFAFQVHGDKVIDLKKRPAMQPKCDGFMTQARGLPLMVKVADCQGVLMFDPKTKTIAAIHSGWRGSIQNIIGKAVGQMKKVYGVNPKNLRVGISQSLGPCCSEFTHPKNGRQVDFWKMSTDQLQKAGVPRRQVEILGQCTKCHPRKYFSFRAGSDDRMAVFIALK